MHKKADTAGELQPGIQDGREAPPSLLDRLIMETKNRQDFLAQEHRKVRDHLVVIEGQMEESKFTLQLLHAAKIEEQQPKETGQAVAN